MIRYLLFIAKLKYQESLDGYGTDRCDLFLGRVDLLEKLLMANVKYIPSMQQLTQMDTLRFGRCSSKTHPNFRIF